MFVDYENDIVNISPFEGDRKGEVINVGEIRVQLPQQPSDKHILFSDLPKEQQYWRRTEIPQDLAHIDTWEEFRELPEGIQQKYESYIKQEWFRRKNGVWFYNNGKATYLTGTNYMFLQWADFDFGYPNFMYAQWLWHIHAEACFVDPRCFGQIVGKNRRWGWTSMATNYITDKTSQKRKKKSGIISKNEEDAEKVVFSKVNDVFNGWPFFYKVISYPKGNALLFDEPPKRITRNNKTADRSEALKSSIQYGATKNNTFDGSRLYMLLLDEMGKLNKPANFEKLWDVHKPALSDRVKVIGKAFVGTTVEEMEKGGEAFKSIYYQSSPEYRMDNGRTKSGLYRFFVSSLDTLVIDRYGMPVRKDPKEPTHDLDGNLIVLGSESEINAELKARKSNPAAVNEYKRLYPVTESDMFRILGGNSLNTERIYTQIQYNENLTMTPYRRGVFQWTGERFNSPVKFVDDARGQWRVTMLLDEKDANRWEIRRGAWYPANTWLGSSGVDPYRVDQTTDGRGSNASCHIFTRFNTKYPPNTCIARYNGRPETAYMASEQILMAHIYYGIQSLIESQVDIMIRHWTDLGFQNYLMDSPPHLTAKGAKRKGKGISTSGENVRHALLLALQTYVNDYIGPMEGGGMGNFYFNETLNDISEFDIHNATKHDDGMSMGIALLSLQNYKEKTVQKIEPKQLFRRYDNSGTVSKLIK